MDGDRELKLVAATSVAHNQVGELTRRLQEFVDNLPKSALSKSRLSEIRDITDRLNAIHQALGVELDRLYPDPESISLLMRLASKAVKASGTLLLALAAGAAGGAAEIGVSRGIDSASEAQIETESAIQQCEIELDAFLRHPSSEISDLESLYEEYSKSEDPNLRREAVMRTERRETIERLSQDEAPDVQKLVAETTTLEDVLMRMWHNADPVLRAVVEANPSWPSTVTARRIAAGEAAEKAVRIEADPSRHGENVDAWGAQAVYHRLELLEKRILDGRVPARRSSGTADSPDMKIAVDNSVERNRRIDSIRRLDNDRIVHFVADEDDDVRFEVADRATDETTLLRLVVDPNQNVSRRAASRITSDPMLRSVADSRYADVRMYAALRATDRQILRRLKDDPHPGVQEAAESRLKEIRRPFLGIGRRPKSNGS